MDAFNFAEATFVKANDGSCSLDRDWTAYPPTQIEVEALFAHWLQFDRFLSALVSHYANGELVIAEGLDGATAANVIRFLVAVGDAVTPPTFEEASDAGAG